MILDHITITWHSIFHGPEVWLALAGLCGVGVLAGGIGAFIFWKWEDNDEDKKR